MRALAIILLLTVPALAQMPQQQQITPSQAALQINAAIAQMATALEAAHERIRSLEAENEQLKKAKPK